jgi:hypothetical protein
MGSGRIMTNRIDVHADSFAERLQAVLAAHPGRFSGSGLALNSASVLKLLSEFLQFGRDFRNFRARLPTRLELFLPIEKSQRPFSRQTPGGKPPQS